MRLHPHYYFFLYFIRLSNNSCHLGIIAFNSYIRMSLRAYFPISNMNTETPYNMGYPTPNNV